MDNQHHTFRTDTIVVQDGALKHRGQINEAQVVMYQASSERFSKYRTVFKDGDSVKMDFAIDRARSIEIVIAPGARIKISGVATSFLDAYPSGTKENVQLETLNRKVYPLLDSLGNLDYTDKKALSTTIKHETMLLSSVSKLEAGFIKKYPSSTVSSYLVWKQFQSLNRNHPHQADSVLQLIAPSKNNIYRNQMLAMQKDRGQRQKKLAVGDVFPSFVATTVYKGTRYDLTQTRGKYTLIDFWGTWCIPCVREMPKLKAFYEKYHEKLNIVGIASDKYLPWKTFLDRNAYPWVQLLDERNPKLSDALNIRVYPTKYLLDPSGKIVRIFKDADEDVWKALDGVVNP